MFLTLLFVLLFAWRPTPPAIKQQAQPPVTQPITGPATIASESYSLLDRYRVPSVNNVFADNILLTLSYMSGQTKDAAHLDWNQVRGNNTFSFVLGPGKTFAFHDEVDQKYQSTLERTTNAHFMSYEGFKSDGYLVGDGVCHLASFINAVASKAGLAVDAPVRHDFAPVPDVNRINGTAIFYDPTNPSTGQRQNLYVTNTTGKPLAFVFTSDITALHIAIQAI